MSEPVVGDGALDVFEGLAAVQRQLLAPALVLVQEADGVDEPQELLMVPTTKLRLRFSGFTSPLVVVSASEIGPFTVMVSVFT